MLGREDLRIRDVSGLFFDGAGEGVGERQLSVPGQLLDRVDRRPADGGRAEPAPQARGQNRLPLGARAVEALARRRGAVAECRVARPEVDAGSLRLVRIVLAGHCLPLGPAPRPDGAELHLLSDVARGQHLPLHRLEPRLGREPLAPAGALRRLEADEDAELRDGDADLREVEDPVPERLPQRPVPEDRSLLPDQRRREVDLADDAGHVGDLAPPVAGRTCRVRRRVDEQPRLRAARTERLQEEQDVGAVLGVRRRPGHGEPRAEELVLGDDGVRAVHRLRGVVVELVRLRDDRRRIRGRARRPHALVEVEVEIGGLRTGRAQLGRKDQVRRERDDPGPGELLPERDRPVGEVEPDRRLGREDAVRLQLLCGRSLPSSQPVQAGIRVGILAASGQPLWKLGFCS